MSEIIDYSNSLSIENFPVIYDRAPNGFKIPSLISAGSIINGRDYSASLQKLAKPSGSFDKLSMGSELITETIIFEVTAYTHYWLLKDDINRDEEIDDQEEDHDEVEDNPLIVGLNLSSSIFSRFMSELPKDLMEKRVMIYSQIAIKSGEACVLSKFTQILANGIINKKIVPNPNHSEMPRFINSEIMLCNGIYHKTILPGLQESLRRIKNHFLH